MGPKLPPHLVAGQAGDSKPQESIEPAGNTYGPALPPGFSEEAPVSINEELDDDDDVIIGPMPGQGQITVSLQKCILHLLVIIIIIIMGM